MHHTKDKGDIAATKAIADLVVKGFSIFVPVVSEHLPFDIIAYKEGVSYRIQCKYSTKGFIAKETSWSDKNGSHKKIYSKNDFDYYAIYIPDIDKVLYPSISFAGKTLTSKVPNSATPFYWYEDFTEFTDFANKKTYRDFKASKIN